MRRDHSKSKVQQVGAAAIAIACAVAVAGCGSADGGGESSSAASKGASATPSASDSVLPGADGAATTTYPLEAVEGPGGPEAEPVSIPAPLAAKWRELGGVNSTLGAVQGPSITIGETVRANFSGGSLFLTGQRVTVVQGEILRAYDAAGGPAGRLGPPLSDEATTDGGWISVFTHGTITFIDGKAEVIQK